DVEARLARGRALLGQHRTVDAVAELKKVATSRPIYASGRYYVGLAYMESADFEKAESELQACITNDNGFTQAYVALAEIKLNAGQLEQAIKYARQALANPSLIQAHLLLARAYMAGQDFTSATREVNAFLEQAPGTAIGIHHLGLIKLAQGNSEG